MKRSSQALESLRAFIARRAVLFDREHRLLSPSGKPQSWMIDMRPALLSSAALQTIGDIFWERFESELPFQVGGMEMAAVPLVSAILLTAARRGHEVDGFVVRKERKPHGRMQVIENELNGLPIVVVDDIFNSGASLEKVRTVLRAAGRSIWQVWCLVDFGAQAGSGWQRRHGIAVSSLFGLADFGLTPSVRSHPTSTVDLIARWQRTLGPANSFHSVPKSAPRCHAGRVLIGSESGAFHCLDGATGERIWSFDTGSSHGKGIWSSPCVAGSTVLFGSYDGNLYALDVESGEELWRNVEADWIGSSPCAAPELGLVFVGLEHAVPGRAGGIAAFDLVTGSKRWEVPTRAFVHASPQYDCASGSLVCGTNDGLLVALDATTGDIRWRVEVAAAIKHAPAIDTATGVVVVGAFDGTIRCFDLKTGAVRFTVQTGNAIYTTALINEGRIYCGSTDRNLYVVDLESGSTIASIPVSAKVFCAPKRIGDWVWFGATDGRVRALDPETLAIVSDTQLSESITSEFGHDEHNDRLVVVTNAGSLHSFSVVSRDDASIARRNIVCRRLRAIELARLTVQAFIHGRPLPDPRAFEVADEPRCGGAFASLRDRRTGERLARAGFWVFDDRFCSSAYCIIAATAKACERSSWESLAHVDIGLTMIGDLERVTLGHLDANTFGVVVRSKDRKRIGGALPNSPEFANESGQYLHALRNAHLEVDAPHEVYRHEVRKYAESPAWPPFGARREDAPSSRLSSLVALLSGSNADAVIDPAAIDNEICAIALSHYRYGRVASVLHRVIEPHTFVSTVRATLDRMRAGSQASPADGGIVMTVLLRGKRLPGKQRIGDHTLRITSDALIRVETEGERVHLPMVAMQRNMKPADVEYRLRRARSEATLNDETAWWEICPSQSWLLAETGPIPIEGALTRPEARPPHAGTLLEVALQGALARIDALTADQTIYLPVTDTYIAAQNGNEQYVAWLAAVASAAEAIGCLDAHKRCIQRIDAFLNELNKNRSRWRNECRAALRALLACSHTAFDASAELIRASAASHDDALAVCVSLKAAKQQGRTDLREWCSPVAAGLNAVGRYRIRDSQWWAQAANDLVRAGHDRLRTTLLDAARHIASTQLPASGAFVPAMNAAGPTAATAAITLVLSTALDVVRGDTGPCADLIGAWRRSIVALDALRIREADAFCLKAPDRALHAIRDALGTCVVSATSCAAVLAACTHAVSIGLDDWPASTNVTPASPCSAAASFAAERGVAELDR